ncbi:hypothetical protein IV203_006375 [Nitzschia inconspicua]|uniref:Uncharacterized protein n=1 Tax=Nitzschia inconspicua TaxID=303405 RepID=A0A9K3PA70_9STRA|nr:hypothetical protein IV203_006599 [Nitzschia inconspicua]KAG7339972.1 hypothetical protein IV203_006375 [Nitzschia inconspicua]
MTKTTTNLPPSNICYSIRIPAYGLLLWTVVYAVFCVGLSQWAPFCWNDDSDDEDDSISCLQPVDKSTMAWATTLYVAGVTVILAFSLFVHVDTRHNPSLSTVSSQLPWIALALWSISLACRGIIVKVIPTTNPSTTIHTMAIGRIVQTTLQTMAILIMGVLIQTTSWKTTQQLQELQDKTTEEPPKKRLRRTVEKQSTITTMSPHNARHFNGCGIQSLRLLAWIVLLGAILIIIGSVPSFNTENSPSDVATIPSRLLQVGSWVYTLSIILFVMNASLIWSRHARMVNDTTFMAGLSTVASARLLTVLQIVHGIYRLVLYLVERINPTFTFTQSNLHNAILSYFILLTMVVIHNVLLSLLRPTTQKQERHRNHDPFQEQDTDSDDNNSIVAEQQEQEQPNDLKKTDSTNNDNKDDSIRPYGQHPHLQYSSKRTSTPHPTRIDSIRKLLSQSHRQQQQQQTQQAQSPHDLSDADRESLEAAVTATTRADTTSTIQPRHWIFSWGRRHHRNVSTIDHQGRQNRGNNNKSGASDRDDEPSLITELAHNLTRPSLTKRIPSNLRTSSKFQATSNPNKTEKDIESMSRTSSNKSVQWDGSVVVKSSRSTQKRKRLATLFHIHQAAACFDDSHEEGEKPFERYEEAPSMLETALESGFSATLAAVDTIFSTLDGTRPLCGSNNNNNNNQHKTKELLNDDGVIPSPDSADIPGVVNPCDGRTSVTVCVTAPNDDELPSVELSEEVEIAKGFFSDLAKFLFPTTGSIKTLWKATTGWQQPYGNDIESGDFVEASRSSPLAVCTDDTTQSASQVLLRSALACSGRVYDELKTQGEACHCVMLENDDDHQKEEEVAVATTNKRNGQGLPVLSPSCLSFSVQDLFLNNTTTNESQLTNRSIQDDKLDELSSGDTDSTAVNSDGSPPNGSSVKSERRFQKNTNNNNNNNNNNIKTKNIIRSWQLLRSKQQVNRTRGVGSRRKLRSRNENNNGKSATSFVRSDSLESQLSRAPNGTVHKLVEFWNQ